MPSYAVDNIRQPMTATGIVEQIMEWEETPDGRRRPSERQARSENTGMPLWAVEVLYIQTTFGRRSTVTAKVTVEAADEPKPSPLTPIGFSGLRGGVVGRQPPPGSQVVESAERREGGVSHVHAVSTGDP